MISVQTKTVSLIEVCMNVSIGFCVSFAAWPFVAEAMGYPYSVTHNFAVTGFFTVLSVARGYIVRRFFARGLHSTAINLARRLSNAHR